MTTDSSSKAGMTIKQSREFWDYLNGEYASINKRSFSSSYHKANRHEAERVRETMNEFYSIYTGVKSLKCFSSSDEIENGLSSEQVSAMLSYVETRKCELEKNYEKISSKSTRSDWEYEDMEQHREQSGLFQRFKEKLEHICAG